ncbi:hypothetical protein ACIPJN_30030 [Streptomyces sp. NPDC086796]|uniref:hypothetical protein n=1 Tax=Streptomyces sp. NPDC086796 TaxID=3365760 RepID=UPI00380CD123
MPGLVMWGGFRKGDIVAVQGRRGEWELMSHTPAPGVWQIEAARPKDRAPAEAHTVELLALADAPQVHRGDLVVQNFPEQVLAGTVGHVYRLGRWVAEATRTEADGHTWGLLDDVERLVVVTREQLDTAVQLDVEAGAHRGRIIQAVVTRHTGKFRVICRCSPTIDLCRAGRATAWCSSVEAAWALWDWHTTGEAGPAPADFASPETTA